MKHHNAQRKFGRIRKQRTALLADLARSLVIHERIATTEAKAKELRPFVEKLVTAARVDSVPARRRVAALLGNRPDVVEKLFSEIGPRFAERPGGYTRITKLGRTGSDARETAQIEFVA